MNLDYRFKAFTLRWNNEDAEWEIQWVGEVDGYFCFPLTSSCDLNERHGLTYFSISLGLKDKPDLDVRISRQKAIKIAKQGVMILTERFRSLKSGSGPPSPIFAELAITYTNRLFAKPPLPLDIAIDHYDIRLLWVVSFGYEWHPLRFHVEDGRYRKPLNIRCPSFIIYIDAKTGELAGGFF